MLSKTPGMPRIYIQLVPVSLAAGHILVLTVILTVSLFWYPDEALLSPSLWCAYLSRASKVCRFNIGAGPFGRDAEAETLVHGKGIVGIWEPGDTRWSVRISRSQQRLLVGVRMQNAPGHSRGNNPGLCKEKPDTWGMYLWLTAHRSYFL